MAVSLSTWRRRRLEMTASARRYSRSSSSSAEGWRKKRCWGGGYGGDYKSRCIGGEVVVALVRAFVRPISEMKGKVEDKRHSRRLRLRWPYRKKATTTGPVDREQAFIRIGTRHSANENLRGGVRRMTILRDDRLERVSSGSGTPSLVGYG